MRRHLVLILSVLSVASLAVAGITNAGASTARPLTRPRMVVKITSGSNCNPTAEFCFKPATFSVVSGTKVVWKNTTIAQHTATRCTTTACSGVSGGTGTDAAPASGFIVASGGKYAHVFKGVGTYVYYCMVHGYLVMHGTITVTAT